MESTYKAKFINCLSGYKSVNLIGTKNTDEQTNLAIFSSVVHLGTSPALVGFIMRPDNGSRHTLNNIVSTKEYTINQVSTQFYKAAHDTSARYDKNQSEFIHTGLSEMYINHIKAPFVKESRLKYAVKLKEIIPITLNDTQFIIGEIIHVICDDSVIQADGYINIEALNTVSVSGLDSYHSSNRLSRLSYAKTDKTTCTLQLTGSVNLDE